MPKDEKIAIHKPLSISVKFSQWEMNHMIETLGKQRFLVDEIEEPRKVRAIIDRLRNGIEAPWVWARQTGTRRLTPPPRHSIIWLRGGIKPCLQPM